MLQEKNFIHTHLVLTVLLALVLGACDETSGQSEGAIPLTGDQLAEAKEVFEGHFALQVTTTTEQELPVVGVSRSTSVAKKLLTVREENGRFFTEEKFCEIVMISDGPASPSVPTNLVDFIPSVTSTLNLEKSELGWQWERPRTGLVLGARLDQPLEDTLPMSADDELVWDQDMDGQPGVTLNVTGLVEGDIYTLIRYVDTLSGDVNDSGWTGHTQDETEQVIVGASQEVLKLNVTPVAVDDPSLNTALAYPIAADGNCEDVLTRLAQ